MNATPSILTAATIRKLNKAAKEAAKRTTGEQVYGGVAQTGIPQLPTVCHLVEASRRAGRLVFEVHVPAERRYITLTA